MAEKTVSPTSGSAQPARSREATRAEDRYVAPAVDIYETPEELVLVADLPGVGKDDLEVRVEEDVLTIRATPKHAVPGEVVWREFELPQFFRQFELSEVIDQEKISADFKHGVLTLHLPKAEKAKPRKIEVKVS
ncbi:MAG: heat-shock protein [Candidatus Binatia bacterium]|nr:MAG: heat-shock protein [Fimbriimonadales bacterium]GIW44861.1 MAG: heat-shock protein [Candidatus Binatia bacterium]